MEKYKKAFLPYAFAAFLIGIVGGFSTVLGPAFVADLGLSYNNTTWTALSQAISTAACAPVLGKLGDILGRKRTLLLGLATFTLGNVLTALANSLVFMLVARFIVGLGTAAMAPVILGYIVAVFPADRVAKGFSAYMLISSASVIFGPTLGGILVAESGWRSMVWVCVAICAAVGIACLSVREKEPSSAQKAENFDIPGGLLILLFFGFVLCIPSLGQNLGWSSSGFLFVLTGAALTLPLLIFAERRATAPLLSGELIGRKNFLLSVLALFLTQGLMQANMTCIIVFVNYTHAAQGALSGYAISVLYLGMSLGAVLLGPLADRFEPKTVLTGSLLLTGLGCAVMLLFREQTPLLIFMVSLGILGLGLGGNATIFMKVALSGLSPRVAGVGTGTYGLFRDLAAPFGVAVLVPLFTNTVSDLLRDGLPAAQAAVRAVHLLAETELICVVVAAIIVRFLPTIHNGGTAYETEK